jgi:hypothetical protein
MPSIPEESTSGMLSDRRRRGTTGYPLLTFLAYLIVSSRAVRCLEASDDGGLAGGVGMPAHPCYGGSIFIPYFKSIYARRTNAAWQVKTRGRGNTSILLSHGRVSQPGRDLDDAIVSARR